MSTTYMPNGDVIETRYDGGSIRQTEYMVFKNGKDAGALTIYRHADGSCTFQARDNTRRMFGNFPNSTAAIDYLTA